MMMTSAELVASCVWRTQMKESDSSVYDVSAHTVAAAPYEYLHMC